MTAERYLELSLDELLRSLAAGGRAPGGGSAAALAVALAASVAAMVARSSQSAWDEAAGVAAQALALRERAAALAEADAEAWEDALAALESAGEGGDPRRDFALAQRLSRAAEVPLEIAVLAADTAALAAAAADRGDGAYRADAAAAAALAAGAASAAAHLVQINLAVRQDDQRLARAQAAAQTAWEDARSALDAAR